jgi:hypothetical protein
MSSAVVVRRRLVMTTNMRKMKSKAGRRTYLTRRNWRATMAMSSPWKPATIPLLNRQN